MADRPILFSTPMVLALLAGRKTQTRRVIKPQPEQFEMANGEMCLVYLTHTEGDDVPRITLGTGKTGVITTQEIRCAVGDRLWVRETLAAHERDDGTDGVIYRADGAFRPIDDSAEAADRWCALHAYRGQRGATVPPIHVPRWTSRITLDVTDVRVERLQSISTADAVAEGLIKIPWAGELAQKMGCDWGFDGDTRHGSPESAYASLWDSINGPGAWNANPWVAAYTFDVHLCNIDLMGD